MYTPDIFLSGVCISKRYGDSMSEQQKSQVVLFTDGACSGNPGRGGYGVLLLHGPHRKELSGGFRKTTNNRMELLAVIEGLKSLKRSCKVAVYTDSNYIVQAINKGWAQRWRANGWMRNKKDKAENPDLWVQLLALCDIHDVAFNWVRGHAGHPENELVDGLAVAAAQDTDLAIDELYEQNAA